MIRRPPTSTLFPYTTPLPICPAPRDGGGECARQGRAAPPSRPGRARRPGGAGRAGGLVRTGVSPGAARLDARGRGCARRPGALPARVRRALGGDGGARIGAERAAPPAAALLSATRELLLGRAV